MLRSMLSATALAVAAVPAHAQTTEQYRQLQQRVERLEGQTKGRGQGAFNPDISVILQGTAARIKEDPKTYQITGFAPSGGEVGPPRRGFSLGESELMISGNIDPYFARQLVAALTPEDEIEVEEAFFTDARAWPRLHAERRALPFRHRLPERDPPARLGLPGRAARLQGVPGRASERRRHAGEMGRADRFPARAGRRGRARTTVSRRPIRTRTAPAPGALSRTSAAISARARVARGASYLRASPSDRAFEDIDSLGARQRSRSPAMPSCGSRTSSSSGREWQCDAQTSSCRASTSGAEQDGQLTLRRQRRAATSSARSRTPTRAAQSGWYAQARVPVPAAVARRLPLRPAGPQHARQRHRRQRPRADRGRFSAADDRPQSDAQHAHGRLEPDRVQPRPAAVRVRTSRAPA